MRKVRVKYRKEGRAIYISHLDTMRTLQRVIARAEIKVKHSEGFNPHPYISIALPLSLGYSSECEYMDIVVLDEIPLEEIVTRLNEKLPEGIVAVEAYENADKVGNISASGYRLEWEYDNGLSANVKDKIFNLFQTKPLHIIKKSKSGEKEVDLTEFIKKIEVGQNENNIVINTVVSAGNENLNPEYILRAVEKYLPEYSPNFAKYHRTGVFDKNFKEFR